MNMLNNKCRTSFAKPESLKKAQRANPPLYDIGCYNDNLALMLSPNSNEVIRLEKESRSKLSDLIRPFDYDKLNNLYDLFVPQCEKSSEQRYFSERSRLSHISVNNRKSKEAFNKQTTLLEKQMDESISLDKKCQSSIEIFKVKTYVNMIIIGVKLFKQKIANRMYIGYIDPFIQRVIPTTSVSRPQLKSNPIGDRVMRNSSQGKKQEVEDHCKSVKLSKNKTSVTVCNDSLIAKTLNVKSVSAMCDKCVLIDKHDMCVLKSVAKPLKETVSSESNKKPRNFTRKLYESDLKAQLQDKCIVISELKKLIEKLKGKSVDTKFEKSSVIRQPNAFKSQRPSVLGKPTTFSNSFIRKDFSKSTSVTQSNVSNDFLKPVTAQTLPANKKSCLKNTNVLAPGMYKLHTDHTRTRTSKFPQDSKKTNKRVSFSIGVIPKTSVSRPQLKNNPQGDRVLRSNSREKKLEVEEHCRNVKLPKNKTSVTACVPLCQILHCLLILLQLIEIVLFIVDSGCLKHMMGNLKLLINFVEKFLGMVKFENDQIAHILGYRDLVQGAVTIKRVYYVEGLNHNLFSVGQFCDADLEVAFRKSTCFIRDLKGNDLLTGSRGSDLYSITLQNSNSPNPICLMAKAMSSQAWLWHRRLYTWTHFLRSKDETPEVLIDFLRLVQRGLQAQVRVNSVVERRNRTLVEAARTKGKSVDTKFEKSSVIRQPNTFKSQRPSVLGKQITFSNSFIRKDFSKSTSVTQSNVSNDFSKPVTAQTLPMNKKSCLKNTNVLAPGMYKLHTDHTRTRTSKLPQDSKKTNKRVLFSTGVISTTSISRPQLKSNPQGDRILRSNSRGKKLVV
nr:integrase, catalytic region, zinc finger, CCHC-type, peptidase aspartic, catalytic [Tanacetum cinerariifolium]